MTGWLLAFLAGGAFGAGGFALWCRLAASRRRPGPANAAALIDTGIPPHELGLLAGEWFWGTDEAHRFQFSYNLLDPSRTPPMDDILGRTRWEVVARDGYDTATEEWRRHRQQLERHEPFRNFVYRTCNRKGQEVVISASGRPLFDRKGRFRGYRGISSDITEVAKGRRTAEDARARLVAALEGLDVGIGIYGPDDRLILANARFAALMPPGGPAVEPGMRLGALTTAMTEAGLIERAVGDEAGFLAWYHDMDQRLGQSWEARLTDGRCLQVSERRIPTGDLIVAVDDITKLKRQTWEIDATSRLLQATLENMSQGLAVFGPDHRLLVWNAKYFELLGGDDSIAAVGLPMYDLTAHFAGRGLYQASGLDATVEQICADIVACDPPQRQLTAPDGRILDARRNRMPDGGVAITITDITDLVRREQELKTKSDELELVFGSMDEGIALLDGELRVLSLNRRLAALLEADQSILEVGTLVEDFHRARARQQGFDAAGIERRVEQRMALWRSNAPFSFETENLSHHILEIHAKPTPEGGWVVTGRDVTENRRHEQALKEAKEAAELANRAKSEFLANTSHELRTPLNAVIGFAEVLMGEMYGPIGTSKYLEYARDIRDSGEHLLSLINDLLDLAKIESGRFELAEEPLSVGDLIAACLRLVRERAMNARVELTTELDERLTTIFADERAMKQVLINLMSNAVKFTPPGGRVVISTRQLDGGAVEIAVADTGIGMDEEEIPVALAPFGQVESSLSRRYEGTGLGLPLAQRLIEYHGGTLTLETAKGVGTTVTLHLPPGRHLESLGTALGHRA